MTAQEWLDELERLRKAATPGPWAYEQHGDTNECGVGVILDNNNRQIAGENSDPTLFVAESIALEVNSVMNAAYIVAACNAVPMLVEMVKYLSEEASGEVSCSGEWVIRAAEEVLQDAYQATEPKE
jgi:hypothetical protein